jgi:threonyl-tRNA synthetase
MRILLLHCEHFQYTIRERAVENPESLENNEHGKFQNVLVAFCTIEKEDEAGQDQVVSEVSKSIGEVAKLVHPNNILVYPYAHLSSSLASRDPAIKILQGLSRAYAGTGLKFIGVRSATTRASSSTA